MLCRLSGGGTTMQSRWSWAWIQPWMKIKWLRMCCFIPSMDSWRAWGKHFLLWRHCGYHIFHFWRVEGHLIRDTLFITGLQATFVYNRNIITVMIFNFKYVRINSPQAKCIVLLSVAALWIWLILDFDSIRNISTNAQLSDYAYGGGKKSTFCDGILF